MAFLDMILGLVRLIISVVIGGVGAGLGLVIDGDVKIDFDARLTKKREVFQRTNAGPIVGGKSHQRVETELGRRGKMVVGGSGSGKTSTQILPDLLSVPRRLLRGSETPRSYVAHDMSGQLFIKSAGYSHRIGKQVVVLNWREPMNAGFNMLKRCKDRADCERICSMLVKKVLDSAPQNAFWNAQAEMLLTCFALFLLQYPDQSYNTPVNLKRLVDTFAGDPHSLDWMFVKYANEELFREFKSIGASEERVLSNVITTARTAVKIFGNPSVARVTSFDTFGNFSAFRKSPGCVLYIQCRLSDMDQYSVLTSIFLSQMWEALMSSLPHESDGEVLYFLDEFGSLSGVLKSEASLYFANCRKFNLSNVIVLQDESQLTHALGSRYETENIKSNMAVKVYIPSGGMSIEQATEISRLLGKRTLETEDGHKVVRDILTPYEVRTTRDRAFVFVDNRPGMVLKLTPYFEQSKMLRRSQMLPPEIGSTIPSDIPLIPLEAPPLG